MPSQVAVALILSPDQKGIFVWEQLGMLTLPGVIVEEVGVDLRESIERLLQGGFYLDGVARLNAYDALPNMIAQFTDLAISVDEEIRTSPAKSADGDYRGYICRVEVRSGECRVPYRFLRKEDMAALELPDPLRRMLLDGFSILEEPRIGPNQVDEDFLPIEGIFLSDDGLCLVEEGLDGRKEWRRLDPATPFGFYEKS